MCNLRNNFISILLVLLCYVKLGQFDHSYIRDIDTASIFSRIDAHETRLNAHQDALLNLEKRVQTLENERDVPNSTATTNDDDLEERVSKLEELSGVPGTLRSCYEYSTFGVTSDGEYLVDPDGINNGFDGFLVWCNFTSGETEIYHNNEEDILVEHCPDPGCFQRNVTYKSGLNGTAISISQIVALMELSSQCSQEFQYDCTLAPLQENDVDIGYWQDRHGVDFNTYWTGSNYGFHVCDCHYSEEGCMEEDVYGNTCSCDANVPVPQRDTGTINNMTALPLTKISLGGLAFELEYASFRLGRLKCFGQSEYDVSNSCDSLKKGGQMKSGYYNILKPNDEATSLVFCDMTKGGYNDVPQTDAISLASLPLGSIVSWVPKAEETSIYSSDMPDGWQLCDGSMISKGKWSGHTTPDLNNERRFLRGSPENEALTLEEDMILDHEHVDKEHSHSDSGHSHEYNDYWPELNYLCGSDAGNQDHECHYRVTQRTSYTSYASITSETSNIGKINSETSAGRKGNEVRPKNMHVSFIIRIY